MAITMCQWWQRMWPNWPLSAHLASLSMSLCLLGWSVLWEYEISSIFLHHQSQNNWKPCLDFIVVYRSGWDLKSKDDCKYSPGWQSISWPPPPTTWLMWGENQHPPPFPLHLLTGGEGVLVAESDYKYWVQIKGSSLLTCCSMGSVAIVVLTSSFLSAMSHLLHHAPETGKLSFAFLAVTMPVLSKSPGCLESFFDSLWVPLAPMNAVCLPCDYRKNHLIWVGLRLVVPLELS